MMENFKYDIFIAYAKPDAEFAKKLYQLLSVIGNRVFLDAEVLQAGDHWIETTRQAQRNSLLTVVLVSIRSDLAYFQQEEILSAIELARDERHRVVPVYLGGERVQSLVPSPLKQLHGIFLEEGVSLLNVAQKIEDALNTSKRREEWQHDIDPATIVIVTGCHHLPELYDRPTAYELRDAINHLGRSLSRSFLRSVVLGDIWLLYHSGITDHPNIISIGSPGMNGLTDQIAQQGETLRTGTDGRWRIMRSLNRWGLFGNEAEDTNAAVISFKKQDLSSFLEEVWSST